MARVYTQKARKDYPNEGIQKGEVYYQWQLYHGPVRRSKTPPKRSQLTGSGYLSTLYDLFDQEINEPSDLESIADELESLGQEQRDRFDNMPEGLQQGDTGQMLEQRADACEEAASNIRDRGQEWQDAIDEYETAMEEYNNEQWEYEEQQHQWDLWEATPEAERGEEPDVRDEPEEPDEPDYDEFKDISEFEPSD